jgi:hypothetical protein
MAPAFMHTTYILHTVDVLPADTLSHVTYMHVHHATLLAYKVCELKHSVLHRYIIALIIRILVPGPALLSPVSWGALSSAGLGT